jgi:type II secretory pathway pseudopilin PulG
MIESKDKKMKRAKAFTLAETLITLGIIGVVAAITMPTLIQKVQSIRDSAILKEDFSILGQALRSASNDGAYYDFSTLNNMTKMRGWMDTYLLPYIKVSKICYNEVGCWTGDEKLLNGAKLDSSNNNKGCGGSTISMILNNGSHICMDDFSQATIRTAFGASIEDSLGLIFYIDINGSTKPNIAGKDIFIVVFDPSNTTILPAGTNKEQPQVEQDCKVGGTGRFCMQLVKTNGFKLPVVK